MNKTTKKSILLLWATSLLFLGCEKNPSLEQNTEAQVPKLVSVSPSGEVELSSGKAQIELNFDQSVFCPVGNRSKISITNSAVIASVNPSGKKIILSLEELQHSVEYTVTFPKGCISGYKENIAEEVVVKFRTAPAPVKPERNIDKTLSNPSPSLNAKKLYDAFLSYYTKKSLSGAMGGTAWETSFTDYIKEQTGTYPAIVGFDYLFNNWPPKTWAECPDYNDISVVRNAWKSGSIIQIGWHWNMPKREGETDPNNFSFYNNPVQASRVATEGTWENEEMKRQVAQIAGFLKLLQKEDIPVLWRPLHEAAGDYTWGAWFWWGNGGAEPCKYLWRYMYDTFTKEYGLNNLIWVWTVQTKNAGKLADVKTLKEWYPGHDYVDIIGMDLYEAKGSATSSQFELLESSVDRRKMVALSEFGNLLDMHQAYDNDALWLYYMCWATHENGKPVFYSKNSDGTYSWNNTVQDWKNALNDELTLNRGEIW